MSTSEEGATVLEALVALFILSSFAVGAWQAAGAVSRLAVRIRDAILSGSQLLQIDDTVRGLAARVLPPYWSREEIAEIEDDALMVVYLDGDASKRLVMSFREGVLSIGDGITAVQYTRFRTVTFSLARDEESRPWGVIVEATENKGVPMVIVARFGGTPVRSTRVK